MALFKIFKGTDVNKLTNPAHEEYIPLKDGYCYFDTTTGLFFIDAEVVKEDGTTEIVRAPINASRAIYDELGRPIDKTYITYQYLMPHSIGMGYGECFTEENDLLKVVNIADFVMKHNSPFLIKFFNPVSANSILRINDLDPEPITFCQSIIDNGIIKAGDTCLFRHDDAAYDLIAINTDIINKADLNGPNFSGIPTVPTPAEEDSSTQIANTYFITNKLTKIVDGASEEYNTLKKLEDQVKLKADQIETIPGQLVQFPIIGDGTLTFTKNGSETLGTFSANALTDKTININIPTDLSAFTNTPGYKTTDHNTTYTLSGNNGTVILTPSTGNATSYTITNASQDNAGLMSSADKVKLDSISAEATKYEPPEYTAYGSGLYKITTNKYGHVAAATAVTGHDIEDILGYTPSDNEHTHLYAGSESVGGPANSVKESLSFAVGGVEKGSYNGSEGHRIEINAVDLNISAALKYIGRTNNEPVDSVITLVSGNEVIAEPGNVVIWTEGNIEYLFDDDYTWVKLGEASSFSLAPHIHGNISNQGYITNEEGISLSNRILISDGTGYIEGGIEISDNLTEKFLNENGTWQSVNVDNFYHSTGTWGGADNLTYTAVPNGGAPEFIFTLPTVAENQKGVVGIGNNITLASGIISITRENILTALGTEDVPINITGSAGSLKDSKITLAGDLQGEIIFNGDKEVTAEVTVSGGGGGQMLRADLQAGEALNVIAIPTAITQFINNAEEEMSLLVYQNGLLLNQTENYVIGTTNTTIELVDYSCEAGDLFTFIAISNTGYSFEDVGELGFLPLSGGTLSGLLTLAGDPTDSLHAVTKQYTDTAINNVKNTYVKKAGDTMTGDLTMARTTTIANNTPAKINFIVTQSDNNISATSYIAAYDDLDANSYGLNMKVVTRSGLYLCAGEGAESYLNNNPSASEQVHVCADNAIYFHTNCDTVTNATKSVYITTAGVLMGAAWNDYAEYRSANSTEPGRCIIEVGDDTLTLATRRMQPGASIISDTFGFAIGETDEARTPIAVSGRVLAYGYEDREEFRKAIGRPVCSGPDGTVSIMTDEEYQKYGYCAIGTVSAVPDYETWGSGNVPVNGRIWIKVI